MEISCKEQVLDDAERIYIMEVFIVARGSVEIGKIAKDVKTWKWLGLLS